MITTPRKFVNLELLSGFRSVSLMQINSAQKRLLHQVQGRRKIWKSGRGKDRNMVGIICPPGIGFTDLTKYGGVNRPPAPLHPRFRHPWSFLAAFITGGAQFYHRQYLIVAVEFFILGTFYEFYAWPKKSLLWLIEVGPKVSLKAVLYIQIYLFLFKNSHDMF